MIVHDVIQGSPEWVALHIGRPTASEFHVLMTKVAIEGASKGKIPQGVKTYLNKKLAEWLIGRPVDEYTSGFMARGKEMEPRARAWFECFGTDEAVETELVGFITTDDGRAGCSPDFWIPGTKRGGEIKTLEIVHHVGAYFAEAEDFKPQVQGNLWIAEAELWYRVYFNPHPSLVPVCEPVPRDDEYIAVLNRQVDWCVELLEERKAQLIARGCKPTAPTVARATPTDDRPTEAELRELGDEFFGEPLQQPDFGRTEERILQVATGPLSRHELAVFAPVDNGT